MKNSLLVKLVVGLLGFVLGILIGGYLGLILGGTFLGGFEIYKNTGFEGYELTTYIGALLGAIFGPILGIKYSIKYLNKVK